MTGMNNQDEEDTEQLTVQDFALQGEVDLRVEGERAGEQRCLETQRGTDGVIEHQQVRDHCDTKTEGEKEVLWRKS